MDELIGTPTLRHFAAADVNRPTVVFLNGRDLVVLDASALGTIDVWDDGRVTSYPEGTPVTLVTDADRRQDAVRRALVNLNYQRQQAVRQLELDAERHACKLARVREYAIEAHTDGSIRRQQLDEFLAHFDLPPYQDRIEVSFTVSGRYDRTAADPAAVKATDGAALDLKLDAIAGLDEGSVEFDVSFTAISSIDTDDGQPPRLRVHYELTGGFVASGHDLQIVRDDVAMHLRPDLSRVEGLVTGSALSELQLHSVQFAD